MTDGEGSQKRYCSGTHRIRTPEETWERIRPLLARFGITRVADVTALDRLGIPVFQAIRPASRNITVSQGKAPSPMAARVSAAMESIELYHAEDLSGLAQTELTLQETASIHPIAAESLLWLEGVPRLDGRPMPWVEAVSLASGEGAWLPREMLELDFTLQPRLCPRTLRRTSNGLASGNCREEALLHALCELIERHGLYLAEVGPGRRRPLGEGSIDCSVCRELIGKLRRAGARLAVFDLTWESGVPVVAAELCLPDLPRIFSGSGCHPAPEVALSRALTEAAQSRLTVISGARDDLEPEMAVAAAYEAYESFAEPEPRRSFAELPSVAGDDVAGDLALVVERLTALGHEPFAVDLTRGEIGIPVVRVFAPGLGEAHD